MSENAKPLRDGVVWHVHHAGVTSTFTDRDFIKAMASNKISTEALVWREGMVTWQPLSSLRPQLRTHVSLAWLLFASLAIAASAIGIVFQLRVFIDFAAEHLGTTLTVLAMAIVGSLLPVLGASCVIAAWQHPARQRASAGASIVLLVACCGALYELAQFGAFVIQVPDLTRVLIVLNRAPDATIFPLGEGRVAIAGVLGPHLVRDYRRLETAHGPIRTVVLTSPGGLVEPALALARHLEAQQPTVIVTRECSSACILLAVASRKSIADPAMSFGFHHTYPLVSPQSAIVVYALEQQWREYRDFLAAHGVPAAVLDEAATHGPDSLYSVPARDMVAYGAIRQVLSGDRLPTGATTEQFQRVLQKEGQGDDNVAP